MSNARMALIVLASAVVYCAPDQTRPYTPVLATPSSVQEQAGTLRGDFDAAARSGSLQEAASRWQDFLRVHTPADGNYEDEFQANLVQTAQYELLRVYYLLGRTAEADSLLRSMNPIGL